jgi:hypothetical protein
MSSAWSYLGVRVASESYIVPEINSFESEPFLAPSLATTFDAAYVEAEE